MRIHTRVGWIVAAAIMVIAAFPAAALGQDDGDAGSTPGSAPIVAPASADPQSALGAAEALVGTSIANATNNPDNGYSPLPTQITTGSGDTTGSAEANTRLQSGVLTSEIVLTAGGIRTVAKVNAQVCPDAQGHVTADISVSVLDNQSDTPRTAKVRATGTSDDNAKLTSVDVPPASGKGKTAGAKLMERIGRTVLEHAEKGWRNGLCVKVVVSEGDSQVVTPKGKVRISATAELRSGGGSITGRMEATRTAGKGSVEPAQVSDSPAKFTYTGPDKTPETGEVTLKAVSRRGIGTATLEYTTAADLKINAYKVTAIKCGGPAGPWKLHFEPYGSDTGDANATFTLAEGTLTGTYAFSGYANVGGGFSESGTVSYVASTTQSGTGTLVMNPRGSLPVTVGSFCKDGVPSG